MNYLIEIMRVGRSAESFAGLRGRHEYRLRVEGGRFTGGLYTAAEFDWNDQLRADLEALRSPSCPDETQQRVGNQLRQFLGQTDWSKHEDQIQQALDNGPVYLTLRLAADEMFVLPWDLLTIQATGEHISERENLFLGYAWPDTYTGAATDRHGITRILFAWSAAGGRVPAADHLGALAMHPNFNRKTDVVVQASLRRLRQVLRAGARTGQPVSALHLLCHGQQKGTTFGLILNDDENDSVFVSPSRLRKVLRPHSKQLRLVVVSACDGGDPGAPGTHLGSVAQALHRIGIQWVIASRYPLSRTGSVEFAEMFYKLLFREGRPVEEAFAATRRELALDPAHRDWASLQLYVRHEDRPQPARPTTDAGE